jgi:hypothetical protein
LIKGKTTDLLIRENTLFPRTNFSGCFQILSWITASIRLNQAGCWGLTPGTLVTQEVELRRMVVQSQPWQIAQETLSRKYPTQNRASEWFKW